MAKQKKHVDMSYGSTLYDPSRLKEVVPFYHKSLVRLLERDEMISNIVTTGSSGSVLAGALMMQTLPRSVGHIHCNKPGDGHSHSGHISGIRYGIEGRLIFVDDFISRGKSLERCVNAIKAVQGEKYKSAIRYALVAYGSCDVKRVKIIFAGNTDFTTFRSKAI